MGQKLEGKIAVITGGTSGMALATATLFVEEGAYVFITGRRQEQLDAAVKEIGRNVSGVQELNILQRGSRDADHGRPAVGIWFFIAQCCCGCVGRLCWWLCW